MISLNNFHVLILQKKKLFGNAMKFVDVKNDIAFRKVFGNENRKESLISFLNAILDFKGGQTITAVTILNPYQLPKLRGGKVTIIDVKATDQSGNTFIIEMQVADIEGFDKRVLYYSSKSYTDQIKRGDFYRKLKPVIFIGILDFEQTRNKSYISRSQVRDIETGEQTIKDIEFNFIELPKFNKKINELKTLTEKWVYFIKNAEDLEVIPDDTQDEGLKSAYEEANVQTWTTEELAAYDYAFMREEDERAKWDKALKNAEKKGLEIGEKKGLEVGEKKGARKKEIEVVIGFNKIGVPIEKIADALNISITKVQQILDNNT